MMNEQKSNPSSKPNKGLSNKQLSYKEAGVIGEDAVADFLKRRGHRIITQNYETFFGELDIVSIVNGTLVFTEVKTKQNTYYGEAWRSLTPSKRRSVKKSAYRFIKDSCWDWTVPYYVHGIRFNLKYERCRYDFAEVLLNGERAEQIIYTKNAI